MAEKEKTTQKRRLKVRHRGRVAQIRIYFGKFLRMFVYQNDWKVLPMAALIAGLVAFVMSRNFMKTMEGTLTGSFALACICIWNGCFNSIQVICRERDVIKREHRSGMHITSYIIAHMLYQFILCVLQTAVTLVVTSRVGMAFKGEPLITGSFLLDFGISILLITYAADMMSLWISALSRSTTTAMTVMPFLLVFQLVFSGGIISIPKIAEPISSLTVSRPGMSAMAAQTDVNSIPYASIEKMLSQMETIRFSGTVTIGQAMDVLQNKDNPTISELRSQEIGSLMTLGELLDSLANDPRFEDLRNRQIVDSLTLGTLISVLNDAELIDNYKDIPIGYTTTLGEAVDYLASNRALQAIRDKSISFDTTMGDVLDMIGKEDTQKLIEDKVAEMNYNPDYEHSADNIMKNWLHLVLFIVVFSVLAVITLEFIDKDKR